MNAAGWLSNLGALALLLAACDAKQSPEPLAGPVQPTASALPPLSSQPIRRSGHPDLASQQRANPTVLLEPGPSPQPFDAKANLEGLEEVHYSSEGRELKAWLHRGKPGAPVFVYLHGGFASEPTEAYACPQFAEAGYTVLAPTYRGENGNPGPFELMFGEVRDAAAAVRYAHSLAGVDADRIVVFGHSIGAGTAALLATMEDAPVAMTGGVGGMYDPMTVEQFLTDYGVVDPVGKEVTLRTPTAMLESMRVRHHAFTGEQDIGLRLGTTLAWLQSKGAEAHPLRVYDVPGDHFESVAPACAAFFELAQGRTSPVAARSAESLDAAGRDPTLEMYNQGALWGQGPFGKPPPKTAAAETQIVEHEGWQIAVPLGSTLKTVEEGPLKSLMFQKGDAGGILAVLRPYDGKQPLDGAFSTLMTIEPTAARFFFESKDAVGLEARGQVSGFGVYLRGRVTQESVMTLSVVPGDDATADAIVASLKPLGESFAQPAESAGG